ncbi:ankyrin repeat domain-containing protein [Wolbachia endosymbiont of Ctenocephalides felis wCfeT]|uniref:ankyrin repeat domain-containing protein n=1 Tax=Wolbachia endosymbiont of Ctenocephalides felis wCfeT TaxID=2732593 RepID=UPI0014484885|nr:ankyrin repeat domain-containing protein [Wolbachia endosymbiont of Ctenocephalides felis wCfeT]
MTYTDFEVVDINHNDNIVSTTYQEIKEDHTISPSSAATTQQKEESEDAHVIENRENHAISPPSVATTQQSDQEKGHDLEGSEEELEDKKPDFEPFEDALAIENRIERENKIKQLIQGSLDVNATKDGKTILDVAIEKKCSSKLIELLIQKGSKINTIDPNGCTILYRAVRSKNIKVLKVLLDANDQIYNNSRLNAVANLRPFRSAFTRQIEINAKDSNGFTVLDYAKQKSEMYKLLQERGAKHSERFLHSRNINEEEEIDLNRLTSDNDYCFDMLTKALEIQNKNNRARAVDWLIKSGANINVVKNDKTLLVAAAEEGNVENAVLLIKKGVNEGINVQDNSRRTLLLNAILQAKLCYVKDLIDGGIDVKIADDEKNTAMHYAFSSNKVGLLALLQESGLDLYAQNNNGLTPFECALQGSIAANDVDYLFKMYIIRGDNSKNAQLVKNLKLPSGETLLEYFINEKLFDSAKSCIDLGANVNQPLSDGSSLLTKALQNNNIEGVSFLRKNGARVEYNGRKKNTSLYLKVALGCVVAFSLGMGIAATIILSQMSCIALAITAIAAVVTVIALISLVIVYRKIKSERCVSANNLRPSTNMVEAAYNLFSELSSIPERMAEAGALYLEAKENVNEIVKRTKHKSVFIEARCQIAQQSLVRRFDNLEFYNNNGNLSVLEYMSSAIKDCLKIYSNLPLSNSRLISLFLHGVPLELFNAFRLAITDPTLVSTVFTAIRERRWPEDTQWSEILRTTVPNLIRNQDLMQNVIVPALADALKNLSESEEERKFIVYVLVLVKEAIDEVYTPSARESISRILGAELTNNINNVAAAINDLLNCYSEEEIERAKISNELDYLIGKLNSEQTVRLTTYLRERAGLITGFQEQIVYGDEQSIRKLIDYCIDPKSDDELAAKALLSNTLTYIKNGCPDITGSRLFNTDIAQHNGPVIVGV